MPPLARGLMLGPPTPATRSAPVVRPEVDPARAPLGTAPAYVEAWARRAQSTVGNAATVAGLATAPPGAVPGVLPGLSAATPAAPFAASAAVGAASAATAPAASLGAKAPAVAEPQQTERRVKPEAAGKQVPAKRVGPGQDPKFAVLKRDVRAKKQTVATSHPPARTEAANAQDAALPPADDKEAQGKAANAEKMDAAQPKEFDKAAFVKAVKEAIAKKAPQNLDEADKFADSDKPAQVKSEVQGQVGEGKASSSQEIATTTAAPPDTSKAVEKKVLPLKGDRPPGVPGTPNPANAIPDKLPPSATDTSDGPAQIDQQMVDAQVTEPQLAKSNEPKFKKALDGKQGIEREAPRVQARMRSHEAKTLAESKKEAGGLGAGAMGDIAGTRVEAGRQVGSGKSTAKSRDEAKRAQVTATLQKVFDATKKDVEDILSGLDKKVDDQFTREENAAREAFTAEHKRGMEKYKDDRYSGLDGKARWVRDLFAGLPDEANQIFVIARDRYVARMEGVISNIADTIGAELSRAKKRIAAGRTDLQTAVKRLPADLEAIGREAAGEFADKFDELRQSVDDKGTELVDTLADKYTEALKSVDEEIAAEKEKNNGLVDKVVDAVKGVIDTIIELKNLLLGVLRKAAQAVMGILKDPIGFLRNLVSAVGAGLQQFMKNIGRHLQAGLMSWLLGISARAGLQLPAKFDTRGILLMIATLLGLSWSFIRGRIVRKVPEPAVAAAETAVPLAAKAKRHGVGGLWDDIKAQIGDLKQTLISKVIEYLTPTIIIAGIMWVLSLLNPASAFVRACKLIIDIVRFIVERGRQVIEFVNAVLDAVIAIAKGGGGGVPALIERALARSIPVLIGFLAAILGIGGIANKVKKIFQTLSKPIQKAVDWVINKLVGLVKKLWAKLKAAIARKRAKSGQPKRPKDRPAADRRHDRLDSGLDAAVRAVNRFRGRVVQAVVLRPVLAAIRLRYRLTELRLVPAGKFWSVLGSASPAASRQTQAETSDGADTQTTDAGNAKDWYQSQIAKTHSKARDAITTALTSLVKVKQPWSMARAMITKQNDTVKAMDQTPLNQDNAFGEWAHEEAADATHQAFQDADAGAALTTASSTDKRRIAATLKKHGVSRAAASSYLVRYKAQLHAASTPFHAAPRPVQLLRAMVWSGMTGAFARIRATMLERITMGAAPPPQAKLEKHVRTAVLQMLQDTDLHVRNDGEKIYIEFDPATATAITGYLRREASTHTDPKLKKSLTWWEGHILQVEWHHAWPKWLGGPEEQTKLHLPRVLHNFDGIVGLSGGFHQILNAKIKSTRVFAGLKIEDPASWKDFKGVGKKDDMKVLILASYEEVFRRFKIKEAAKKLFVDEAERQFAALPD